MRAAEMFVRVPTPEEPADSELRALRLSLNSPVVALEPLPVGPASAAIALHAVAGSPRISIAVRAERSGERIFFGHDEPRSDPHDAALLLDAGLSFAESMGFLFDDDEVETRGGAGSREASRIWRDFAGLGESVRGRAPAPRHAVEPAPADPAGELATIPLTKFRQPIKPGAGLREASRARIELLGRF